jgi:hypothetical protein
MEAITIQPDGAYFAARYFCALPLVIPGVVWIVRRLRGETGRWKIRRFGFLPLLLALVAYYGVIWNWLFRDQFYDVVPISDRIWNIRYRMPDRLTSLDPRTVVRIREEGLVSITGGTTTGRIVIELEDGTVIRSAQVARHRIPGYVESLRALLPGAVRSR